MSETVLRELPPASLLILLVLEREGPLSTTDLREETRLGVRTTDDALARLNDRGLIDSDPHPEDRRQRVYCVDRNTR